MGQRSAVVFGTGKMACGALGPLLTQAGYDTRFVARREEAAVAINWHQGYRLAIAGPQLRHLMVRRCQALRLEDQEAVVRAVAAADLVMTGVGIDNLRSVAPLIAEGLWRRSRTAQRPSNIVACENLPGVGAYLRHLIGGSASLEQTLALERTGGFSAGLTRRIMTGGDIRNGQLSFAISGPPELVVDMAGLRGGFPRIPGVTLTETFAAHVQRKLFTVNLAQAAAAYVGYRYKCRHIHEAAAHPQVAFVVRGAVREACAALEVEFPRQRQQIARDAGQALEDIGNAALGDTIRRVARDPRRKLASLERLVGPARLAARYGLPYTHLCQAIAAALAYDDPTDPGAQALQQTIALQGIGGVLTIDCGLLSSDALARTVAEEWSHLVTGSTVHVLTRTALKDKVR